MKSLRVVIVAFVALMGIAALPQSDSRAAFEKLKSLQGSWAGCNPSWSRARQLKHALGLPERRQCSIARLSALPPRPRRGRLRMS